MSWEQFSIQQPLLTRDEGAIVLAGLAAVSCEAQLGGVELDVLTVTRSPACIHMRMAYALASC